MTQDPYYGMGSKEAYENALQGWAEFLNEERDLRRVREIVDLPDISTYAAALIGEIMDQEFAHTVEQLNPRRTPGITYAADIETWSPTGILNHVVTERDREQAELNVSLLDALTRNGFRITWEGWVTDH